MSIIKSSNKIICGKYKVGQEEASTDFNLKLYKYDKEFNKVNKTDDLTLITTLYGSLRSECSIVKPIIDIQYEEVPAFNYCYIELFKRYYFIKNITSLRTNLWRIELTVDVLMSNKEELYKQTMFIERNEKNNSPYIIDDKIPIEENNEYEIVKGKQVDNIFDVSLSTTDYFAVVQINNAEVIETLTYSTRDATSTNPYGISFPSILNQVVVLDQLNFYDLVNYINKELKKLVEGVQVYFSPIDYIKKISLYPFKLAKEDVDLSRYSTIKINGVDTNVKGYPLNATTGSKRPSLPNIIYEVNAFSFTADNFKIHKNFLDFEPYTTTLLYLPYIGFNKIDVRKYHKYGMYIKYEIDVLNNTLCAMCYDYNDTSNSDNLRDVFNGKCGIDIDLAKTNFAEVAREANLEVGKELKSGLGNVFKSIAGGVIGTLIGGPLGGVVGAIGPAMNAVGDFVNVAMDSQQKYDSDFRCGNIEGDVLKRIMPNRAYLIRRSPNVDKSYLKNIGGKLMEEKDLQYMRGSGFTIAKPTRLSMNNLTTEEFDELYSLLSSGFIL